MPIPDEERQAWLDQLDERPIETAASVAAIVTSDLQRLGKDEHIRIGTRVLDDTGARSYVHRF
jgi:hypothetical protein